MRVSLNVAVSLWKAPDFGVELQGGRHDLPSEDVKLSAGLLRAIAAAAAVGVLELLEVDTRAAKIIDGAVESDDASAAKYEAAVASGAWLEGHLEDVIAARTNRAAALAEELEALEAEDEEGRRALLEQASYNQRLLVEAEARLAELRGQI